MTKEIEMINENNEMTTEEKRKKLEGLRGKLKPFRKKVIVKNQKGFKKSYWIAYGRYDWHRYYDIIIHQDGYQASRKALNHTVNPINEDELNILYNFFFIDNNGKEFIK